MAKKPSQFDLIIRHQVYLERVKAGMIKDTAKAIKAVENAVVDILKRVEVASLDELSQRQVNTLVRELKQTHLELMGGEVSRLTDELGTLADFTAAWEAASLTNLSKGALQVQAAEAGAAFKRALAQPIGDQGTLLQPFMKQLSDGTAEKLEGVVRNGWQQGSTINDMVRAVRGTRENKFRDGLTQWNTNQADALVRTSAQHVSEQARQATWAANGDIIKGYEIVATLDNRTTQICRSLDGKRFELGKGPVPPLHIRCRTTSVADLGDEFAFLREGATRSSENGYVPADQTYYDWLKDQPKDYVKDTLGPSRAQLFLDGGLTPDEFAKLGYNKQFEPLTLNEMMARNAEVFERAGVENWPGKKALPPVVEDEVPAEPVWPVLKPTLEQDFAIKQYAGQAYDVNIALRSGEDYTDWVFNAPMGSIDAPTLVKDLDAYLGAVPASEMDLVVSRGVRFSTKDLDELFQEGRVFVDKGYMSTTAKLDVSAEYTMRIQVPAGSKNFALIEDIAQAKAEREVLFGRDSAFDVIRVDKDSKTIELRYRGTAEYAVPEASKPRIEPKVAPPSELVDPFQRLKSSLPEGSYLNESNSLDQLVRYNTRQDILDKIESGWLKPAEGDYALAYHDLYTNDQQAYRVAYKANFEGPVPSSPTAAAAEEMRGTSVKSVLTQKQWETSLTDKQRQGIEYWSETLETVMDVRNAVSGTKPMNPAAGWFLDAVEHAPPYKGVVYRGKTVNDLAQFKPGSKLKLRDVLSTSKNRAVAEEFAEYGMGKHKVVMEIRTQKGVDISRVVIEDYRDQDEVVLIRDNNFVVESIIDEGDHYLVKLKETS